MSVQKRLLVFGIILISIVLVACSMPSNDKDNDRPKPTDESFSSERLEIIVRGTGPDVILIPGLASSAAVWDGVSDAIEQDYTLHIVQVSGFAGTPARGNAGNKDILGGLASDIAAYTKTLERPVAVIGHSLGGLVAIKAGLMPEAKIDRLMIVDVLPFFSILIDEAATSESITPIAEIARVTLLAQSEDVFARRQAEALRVLVKDEEHLALALEWSVSSDRETMAQAMSEVLVTDLRSRIIDLKQPVTVLYARDPAIANIDHIEAHYQNLYAGLPDGTLVPMDDAFHFIMLDQESAFIEQVRVFLDAKPGVD